MTLHMWQCHITLRTCQHCTKPAWWISIFLSWHFVWNVVKISMALYKIHVEMWWKNIMKSSDSIGALLCFFSSWIILNFSIFQYEKYRKNHQNKLPKLWIILYHLPKHIIFGFVLIIETQTFYSVSLAMVQWHEIFYGTKSDIGRQSQRTIGAWVGT